MPYHHQTRPPLPRMLRIHEELAKGAAVTCKLLGEILEVSPKTVQRDIVFMRERLELPVVYIDKIHSFKYSKPVESFPTMKVTEGEVVALLIGRKALDQYQGTPFYRELAASFEKIAASLQDKVSFTASDELHTISFKSTGVGRADIAVFKVVSRGLWRELETEFDYRKPGQSTRERRRVRPYHFLHHENLWYLIAFDLARQDIRTFALPRIFAPEVTKTSFVRPPEFSPKAYFAKAFGVFGGTGDYRVVIHFSATVADRVREREWHESEVYRDLPDGGLEFELRLGALPEIERWILSWGAHARVIEPPELRERMKKTALALAEAYA